jgi:hypothetical protein
VQCGLKTRTQGRAAIPRMTGGEATVQALLAQSVDTLSVLPGGNAAGDLHQGPRLELLGSMR